MCTKTEQELGNEARHGRGRQIHLFAINYSPIIWIIKKIRSVAQHACSEHDFLASLYRRSYYHWWIGNIEIYHNLSGCRSWTGNGTWSRRDV